MYFLLIESARLWKRFWPFDRLSSRRKPIFPGIHHERHRPMCMAAILVLPRSESSRPDPHANPRLWLGCSTSVYGGFVQVS